MNESPVFASSVRRDTPLPWMDCHNLDFDDSLPGVEAHYSKESWLHGKIPQISAAARFEDDVSGQNLKRFMREKLVVQEGEGSDRVIGVTSPQLVSYLRIQQEKEKEQRRLAAIEA